MKPLWKHQRESLKFLESRKSVFDTSDPGTAKTRVELEDFSRYLAKARTKTKALVIAPKSLLRNAWGDDASEFTPHLRVSVAYATNREKAFAAAADVYITNTDAVNWLAKQRPAFFSGFSHLIIDESTSFKHHTSGRSKSMNKIKKFFEYRRCMTGTPNSNTICDVWNQVNILDDGKRLGKSFYGFRSAVCEPTQVGPNANMVQWTDKDGSEVAVAGLLADITIRHKFEDCIDIPPTATFTKKYYLSKKQATVYKHMEDDAVTLLRSGKVISAVNQASVRTKLLQIASGAVYEDAGVYHVVETERYDLVLDLVQEREHSLVFYLWKHQRDEIIRIAEARSLKFCVFDGDSTDKEREDMKKHYQAGFYDFMLAHPKSAAHGLTLTKGTATIWASPTDDLEWWKQGNKRQARAGQTQKTEVICVLADQTIEEKLYDRLLVKGVKMQNLLEFFE